MTTRAGFPLALAVMVVLAACAAGPPPPATPHPAPDTAGARPVPPIPAPSPAPPPARLGAPVRLAFVGDINLGTATLAGGVPPDSGRGLFDAARAALAGDLVVGNFEGVLADTGRSEKCRSETAEPGQRLSVAARRRAAERARRRAPADTLPARAGCYAFRTPSSLAPRLVDAGFTHLNLANNHANDYGPAGRASTERLLDSLGVHHYGPGGQIVIDTVRQGERATSVALVGFATYPWAFDLLDITRSAAVVDSIRPSVDLLVVTFHGGSEGIGAQHVPEAAESLGREPRGELRRWAHAVIDAGADAVIGHGPHVLRGIEFYRGRLVAYSLGNFLTYRGFNLAGPLGVTGVLQLNFVAGGALQRAQLVPMLQRPGQGPAPDPARAALELVRRLSAEDFGDTAARLSPAGELTAPP